MQSILIVLVDVALMHMIVAMLIVKENNILICSVQPIIIKVVHLTQNQIIFGEEKLVLDVELTNYRR
jgi:hypothetical protein